MVNSLASYVLKQTVIIIIGITGKPTKYIGQITGDCKFLCLKTDSRYLLVHHQKSINMCMFT